MKQHELISLLEKIYEKTGKTTMAIKVDPKEIRTALAGLRHLKIKKIIKEFYVADEDKAYIKVKGYDPFSRTCCK